MSNTNVIRKPNFSRAVFFGALVMVLIGSAILINWMGREKTILFDGERAMELVIEQENFGPRIPGSDAHARIQELILRELKESQWIGEVIPCSINGLVAYNIVAKQGSGNDWLIIGAHYDSRLLADQESNPEKRKQPVPGANDGASGVAVLLELARVINENRLNQEVWLVFFDLEDNGHINPYNDWILGSTCFVQQLPDLKPGSNPTAAVIVDMIGDADLQIYYEANSNREISEAIWQEAGQLGYNQFIPQIRHSIIDDHTPFLVAGIPAVDIIDFDYPYYHTLGDTSDKVSPVSLEVVGRTLQTWLQGP